jgi:GNAT superfamily N-acetyltransferase
MTRHLILLAENPELVPILARWHFEEWGHLTPDRPFEQWVERMQGRANRDQIPLTVVAFEGEEPVGLASLVFYDMDTRKDLSPWLAGVFVSPAFRGRGHGAALVTAIEEQAAQLGIETLYLYTNTAQGLYERLGWKEIEREHYRGREVVIMGKNLIHPLSETDSQIDNPR